MSSFGKTMEAEAAGQSKKRYTSDFMRLTDDHASVIRVLDDEPLANWSHFVPKGHHAYPTANAGKGMSVMCPGFDTCPVCSWNKKQKEADPNTKDTINTRKVFSFNVLDRTPVLVCPACGEDVYNTKAKVCTNCNEPLAAVEITPRNKVQIMQKGRRLLEQFEAFEKDPDFGDLREYDILINTKGKGTETMTTCVPKQKNPVDLKKIFGDDAADALYDIRATVAPLKLEDLKRILSGEDYYSVIKPNGEEGS